jgi:hypothetical protein
MTDCSEENHPILKMLKFVISRTFAPPTITKPNANFNLYCDFAEQIPFFALLGCQSLPRPYNDTQWIF